MLGESRQLGGCSSLVARAMQLHVAALKGGLLPVHQVLHPAEQSKLRDWSSCLGEMHYAYHPATGTGAPFKHAGNPVTDSCSNQRADVAAATVTCKQMVSPVQKRRLQPGRGAPGVASPAPPAPGEAEGRREEGQVYGVLPRGAFSVPSKHISMSCRHACYTHLWKEPASLSDSSLPLTCSRRAFHTRDVLSGLRPALKASAGGSACSGRPWGQMG